MALLVNGSVILQLTLVFVSSVTVTYSLSVALVLNVKKLLRYTFIITACAHACIVLIQRCDGELALTRKKLLLWTFDGIKSLFG